MAETFRQKSPRSSGKVALRMIVRRLRTTYCQFMQVGRQPEAGWYINWSSGFWGLVEVEAGLKLKITTDRQSERS